MAAPRPTIDEIVKAFHRGTRRAFKSHGDWSGGDWLNAAPEYLLTTYVAESIGKLEGSHYVSLEYSASSTIAEAGARGRGKLPRDMRPDGRVDLVIWNGRLRPTGVIEIKNQNFGFSHLKKDVLRIESMLKRNPSTSNRRPSLKFGAIGLYLDRGSTPGGSSAHANVSTALKNLSVAFRYQTRLDWKPYRSKVHGDKNDAWASFIAVARR